MTALAELVHPLTHASTTRGTRHVRQTANRAHRRPSAPADRQVLASQPLPGASEATAAVLDLHHEARRHESDLMFVVAHETFHRRPGDEHTSLAITAVGQLIHVARAEGVTDPCVAAAERWLTSTQKHVEGLLGAEHRSRPLAPVAAGTCSCGRRYTLPVDHVSRAEPAVSCLPCGVEISWSIWTASCPPALQALATAAEIEALLGLPTATVRKLAAAGRIEAGDTVDGARLFSVAAVREATEQRQTRCAPSEIAAETAKARGLIAAGASVRGAAAEMGVPVGTLHRWLSADSVTER